MNGRHIKRQRGLSLVELMVALAISILLILGVTQVYINNKSSYHFQSSQSTNMDSGRFLQMIINAHLDRAGYRRAPDQEFANAFRAKTADGTCAAFPAEGVITRLADSSARGFCIRYQPAINGEQTCDGVSHTLSNTSAFAGVPESEYITVAIEHVWDDNLHQGKITCNGADFAEGIADFRIEFMLGQPGERRFQSNPFIDASDYNPSSSGVIRGVKYSALLASRPGLRSGDSAIFSGWLAVLPASDTTRTSLESNDSGRIYQVAGSAQVLRNLVP